MKRQRSKMILPTTILAAALLSPIANAQPAPQASTPPQTSILVTIGGKVEGPDPTDLDTVSSVMARAVRDLKLRTWILQAIAPEGGYAVCMDGFGQANFLLVLNEFQSIKVNQSATLYSVTVTGECTKPASIPGASPVKGS